VISETCRQSEEAAGTYGSGKREGREEFVEERMGFIKPLQARSWRDEPVYRYAPQQYAIYDQRYLPRSIHWGKRSATRCTYIYIYIYTYSSTPRVFRVFWMVVFDG
jgi:hypothetical protein